MPIKIAVYAICKNEAAFARRWMESMAEADAVYVLDTGSEDGTPELLRELGARVACEKIDPWRFDVARNRSLELVPEDVDVCVCTDLDEVFRPGWRAALESAWRPEVEQYAYRYVWSFTPEGREGHVFWIDNVHSREGFRWTHPVHEVLTWQGPGRPVRAEVPGMCLDHHPDPNKSRGQYLPLLELSVAEDPEDDRNLHYLGREYYFYGMWEKCIQTLQRHLALPRAVWRDERCASLRYIAKSAAHVRPNEAESWFLRAAAEAPWLREPWLDYARWLYEKKDWAGVLWATERCRSIRTRPRTYITEAESWGSAPWDLGALACWHLGLYEKAAALGAHAAALAPEDARLRRNLEYYRSALAGD